jgi:hypothetical protein
MCLPEGSTSRRKRMVAELLPRVNDEAGPPIGAVVRELGCVGEIRRWARFSNFGPRAIFSLFFSFLFSHFEFKFQIQTLW